MGFHWELPVLWKLELNTGVKLPVRCELEVNREAKLVKLYGAFLGVSDSTNEKTFVSSRLSPRGPAGRDCASF